VNRSFCNRYVTDEELEEEVDDGGGRPLDPAARGGAREGGEGRDEVHAERAQLRRVGEVRAPWDLRLGPPFKLPKHVYLPPRTFMRCVYAEERAVQEGAEPGGQGGLHPLAGDDRGLSAPRAEKPLLDFSPVDSRIASSRSYGVPSG